MKHISFYFEIHQPVQLKEYRFFEIGQDHYYYDDFATEDRIRNLVEQSYMPATRTIAEMIKSSSGNFKCTFSISGVALEQLERYAPEFIDELKKLAKTGSVEFLAETYAHSLASVYDREEFVQQVEMHAKKIEDLFGKRPTTLRNSELIYSDEIGELVSEMGFKTMLLDEAKFVMGWKSPNYVYTHSHLQKLKLLVRNNKLSDDIAFRFSDDSWTDYPLDAEKFISWISAMPEEDEVINIWMGYEALGMNNNAESGIFDFLKAIPYHAIEQGHQFALPAEISSKLKAVDKLHVPHAISWSSNKDLSVWNGNDLQTEALSKLYEAAERVRLSHDNPLKQDWLHLQTTDNFRYMSHTDAYGSHYASEYEAFTNYMNILADFLKRVAAQYPADVENEELNALLKTIENQAKEIKKLKDEVTKLKAKKAKK